MSTVTMSGTIGWTVLPEPTDAYGERMWKWSAYSLMGGSWGYESTDEKATARAREEYTRLTGEES